MDADLLEPELLYTEFHTTTIWPHCHPQKCDKEYSLNQRLFLRNRELKTVSCNAVSPILFIENEKNAWRTFSLENVKYYNVE